MNVKELLKIIEEGQKKDFGFVTKIEIVDHLREFDDFKALNEVNQNKLLNFLYSYWLELDSIEHTCYDYVESVMYSIQYIGFDIVAHIEELDYKKFVDLIEEKALL